MNRLFDGQVLVLGNNDMRTESQGRKKKLTDIKFITGRELFQRANYILYYDEETMELTVMKHRKLLK